MGNDSVLNCCPMPQAKTLSFNIIQYIEGQQFDCLQKRTNWLFYCPFMIETKMKGKGMLCKHDSLSYSYLTIHLLNAKGLWLGSINSG